MKFPIFLSAAVFLLWLCPCGSRAADATPSADKTAEELYALYSARDYFALEARIGSLPPGGARRVFFEGQLDAAFLRDEPARDKLRRFFELPGAPDDWRKEAWLTLGETFLRQGDYAAAARDLERALAEPGPAFSVAKRLDMEQDLALARALRGSPPQSWSDHEGPSTVDASRSGDGFVYAEVHVNGSTEHLERFCIE